MHFKRVLLAILIAVGSASFGDTSFGQFNTSIVRRHVVDACGGWELYRLIAKITLSRYPDSLAEVEQIIDQRVSDNADPSVMFSNSVVSVLEISGDVTRCGYASYYGSCYEDGYKKLTGSIHLFGSDIRSTIQSQNGLLKILGDRYEQVSFSFAFDRSLPEGQQFSEIRFPPSEPDDAFYPQITPLADILYNHRFISSFYCDIYMMGDGGISSAQSDIADQLNRLLRSE